MNSNLVWILLALAASAVLVAMLGAAESARSSHASSAAAADAAAQSEEAPEAFETANDAQPQQQQPAAPVYYFTTVTPRAPVSSAPNRSPAASAVPQVAPQVTPQVAPQVTPLIAPLMTPLTAPQVIAPQVTAPQVAPQVTAPQVTAQVAPQVTPQFAPVAQATQVATSLATSAPAGRAAPAVTAAPAATAANRVWSIGSGGVVTEGIETSSGSNGAQATINVYTMAPKAPVPPPAQSAPNYRGSKQVPNLLAGDVRYAGACGVHCCPDYVFPVEGDLADFTSLTRMQSIGNAASGGMQGASARSGAATPHDHYYMRDPLGSAVGAADTLSFKDAADVSAARNATLCDPATDPRCGLDDPRCGFVARAMGGLDNAETNPFFLQHKILAHPDPTLEHVCYIPPEVDSVSYDSNTCSLSNHHLYVPEFADVVDVANEYGDGAAIRLEVHDGNGALRGRPLCRVRFRKDVDDTQEGKDRMAAYMRFLYNSSPEREFWRENTAWLVKHNNEYAWSNERARQRILDLGEDIEECEGDQRCDEQKRALEERRSMHLQDPHSFMNAFIDYRTANTTPPESEWQSSLYLAERAADHVANLGSPTANPNGVGVGSHLALLSASPGDYVDKWADYGDPSLSAQAAEGAREARIQKLNDYVTAEADFASVWERNGGGGGDPDDGDEKAAKCGTILPRGYGEVFGAGSEGAGGEPAVCTYRDGPANDPNDSWKDGAGRGGCERHFKAKCEWGDVAGTKEEACDWALSSNCPEYAKLFDEDKGFGNYMKRVDAVDAAADDPTPGGVADERLVSYLFNRPEGDFGSAAGRCVMKDVEDNESKGNCFELLKDRCTPPLDGLDVGSVYKISAAKEGGGGNPTASEVHYDDGVYEMSSTEIRPRVDYGVYLSDDVFFRDDGGYSGGSGGDGDASGVYTISYLKRQDAAPTFVQTGDLSKYGYCKGSKMMLPSGACADAPTCDEDMGTVYNPHINTCSLSSSGGFIHEDSCDVCETPSVETPGVTLQGESCVLEDGYIPKIDCGKTHAGVGVKKISDHSCDLDFAGGYGHVSQCTPVLPDQYIAPWDCPPTTLDEDGGVILDQNDPHLCVLEEGYLHESKCPKPKDSPGVIVSESETDNYISCSVDTSKYVNKANCPKTSAGDDGVIVNYNKNNNSYDCKLKTDLYTATANCPTGPACPGEPQTDTGIVLQGNTCVFDSGYGKIDTTSQITCDRTDGVTLDKTSSKCKVNQNEFIEFPILDEGVEYDGGCKLAGGYGYCDSSFFDIAEDGKCKQKSGPTIEPGIEVSGSIYQFVCEAGKKFVSGGCESVCGAGTTWNDAVWMCVPIAVGDYCGTGTSLDSDSKQCKPSAN